MLAIILLTFLVTKETLLQGIVIQRRRTALPFPCTLLSISIPRWFWFWCLSISFLLLRLRELKIWVWWKNIGTFLTWILNLFSEWRLATSILFLFLIKPSLWILYIFRSHTLLLAYIHHLIGLVLIAHPTPLIPHFALWFSFFKFFFTCLIHYFVPFVQRRPIRIIKVIRA